MSTQAASHTFSCRKKSSRREDKSDRMRSSPLILFSRFVSEEPCSFYKFPTLTMKAALLCSAIPNSAGNRDFDAKKLIFSTTSLNTIWKKSIISCQNPSSMFKMSSFTNCRGLSTNVLPEESQAAKGSKFVFTQAREALMDYLHNTRGLYFTDAEHISKHSPNFLSKILKKVENEEDINRSLGRFFRYNPINEFEPFFESIGLKPSELSAFLPRDLIFLSDDEKLIDNYHVLCNYGIARGMIGKIYKEAAEIFGYDFGVLEMKLRRYEALGFSKSSVIKLVSSSPILLVGDVNKEFVRVVEKAEQMSIKRDWIVGVLSENNVYKWSNMLVILQFLMELGFSNKELGTLIKKQPGFLLDGSGNAVFLLVGLLIKSGGTKGKLFSLLSSFPNISIRSFRRNLWRGLLFLIEIEMDAEDIQEILLSHTKLLGSCPMKKANSILTYLSTGKKRLCKLIREDPSQLKNYALGVKVNPLPNLCVHEQSLKEKTNFLLHLGFIKDSKELEKALTVFRGKGDELQERYDFLVKLGFDPNDVTNMIKMAPHVLNQKINVLESKISFLVNNLGYPLSSLVAFPSYLSYTVDRAKLRFSMYKWLKDRGKAKPKLALSSILACSDKIFLKRFVNLDPEGPVIWENFKKASHST